MPDTSHPVYDFAVIGGGINGCGIAHGAAGRGARVLLPEAWRKRRLSDYLDEGALA